MPLICPALRSQAGSLRSLLREDLFTVTGRSQHVLVLLDDESLELVAGRALREAMAGDAVAALTLWSFGHGLVTLELHDRLPPGVDVELLWRHGVEALRPA